MKHMGLDSGVFHVRHQTHTVLSLYKFGSIQENAPKFIVGHFPVILVWESN